MTLNNHLDLYRRLSASAEHNPTVARLPSYLFMLGTGKSLTNLPDGSTVIIGGVLRGTVKNTVCVLSPQKQRHFIYPPHILPPISHHTATVLGNDLWLIGNRHAGEYGRTPVYRMNLRSYQVVPVASRNHIGVVYGHKSHVQNGKIVITGRQIVKETPDGMAVYDNLDDWAFNPQTLRFDKLHERVGRIFAAERADGSALTCGKFPDSLTAPPVPHRSHCGKNLQDGKTLGVIQIETDDAAGVRVRYALYPNAVHLYVLGRLPDGVLDCLTQHLCLQLESLENFTCRIREIPLAAV